MSDTDGLGTVKAITELLRSAREPAAADDPDYFDRKAAVFDRIVAEGDPALVERATEMAAAARAAADRLRA